MLEFRETTARGRAVFAACDISAGTHLLVEEPRICMPLPESRAAVVACDGCCKPVGTISLQAQHLAGSKTAAPELPLYEEDDYLSANVPCRNKSCSTRFCSAACEERLWPAHRFLCRGRCKAANDAIEKFEAHALETEELFLFGARFVAHALGAGAGSLSPFAALCRAPYWDLSDEGVVKTSAEKREVKEACEEARRLLLKALVAGGNDAGAVAGEFLTLEAWGGILGASRRNSILVELSHPMRDLLPTLGSWAAAQPAGGHGAKVRAFLKRLPTPLPECLWTAVYDEISQINHSCRHNCEVHFLSDNHEATLVAKRAIGTGEELFISYIPDNETANVEERRASLRDYGFECDCVKCGPEAGWRRRLRPRVI